MGNYVYTYVADQEKIMDAQQKYQDEENKLYNIRLEAANSYMEQQATLQQEFHEKLKELNEQYLNGEIASEEEYWERYNQIRDFYYAKIGDATHLYQIAVSGESKILQEAWSTDIGTMIADEDTLKKNTDTFVIESSKYLTTYKDEVDKTAKDVGLDLNSISNNVSDITTKSGELKDEVVNETIPAISSLLDEVAGQYETWELHRDIIDETAKKYESLALQANAAWTALAALNDLEVNVDAPGTDDSSGEGETPNPDGSSSGVTVTGSEGTGSGSNTTTVNTDNTTTTEEDGNTNSKKKLTVEGSSYNKDGSYEVTKLSDGNWYKTDSLSTSSEGSEVEIDENMANVNDDVVLSKDEIKSLYVIAEGTDKNGYALIKLSNGAWYSRRSVSGNLGEKAGGSIANTIYPYAGKAKISQQILLPETGETIDFSKVKNSGVRLYNRSRDMGTYLFTSNAYIPGHPGNFLGKEKVVETYWDKYTKNLWFRHDGSYYNSYWLNAKDLTTYDTGGYTGAWGPDGKVAMLHEKELILNKQDTENILSTVSIVRDLDKIISSLVKSINGLYNEQLNSVNSGIYQHEKQNLQQQVIVNAEFPNATNAQEIETALRNLTLDASQYMDIWED